MSHDFRDWPDLAGERLGGTVLWANDEFFAPRERLIREAEPVWDPDAYTERGKWMDGWETRRRREPGHDTCLLRLGAPGVVHGVVVDTRHFRGNHPEECALDGVHLPGQPTPAELLAERVPWRPLLERSALAGDSLNPFPVAAGAPVTHLRFAIHPDGGVARLRVHGAARPDWQELARRGEVDLAAAVHGGRVLAASDMFFGHRHHLVLPGPPRGMHDGWETRRRRGPGNDWVVVALGRPGRPRRLEVDTTHFKGNAPGACSVEGCPPGGWAGDATHWRPLLPRTPLQPDTRHELFVEAAEPVSHVRLSIYPDGGVARLRVHAPVEPLPDGTF
ncbi:MAG TPA: allantoicase [Thermoanaerobaculia bacterium]|nr:allantoicase [Thermoanaerobaculia bacterium]